MEGALTPLTPSVRVVDAARAAAIDAATIALGVPSRALMQRAGAAAATEIALRLGDRLDRGVLVLAGPGNNGGDGWVIARALRAAGVRVRIASPAGSRTPDAIAERDLVDANDRVAWPVRLLTESIVVDALLGTGAAGEPRGAIAEGIALVREARAAGATIVAVDLPSGLDATSGDATHAVPADLTLTFGTLKRGHLVARGACGQVVVLDIGLLHDGALDPRAGDGRLLRRVLPPIAAEAHKGTRGKLAIIGGDVGMAGAVVLAARAALRSGVGMVKALVASGSMDAVQKAEPFALAAPWPADADALRAELAWADAVVLGPGLGRGEAARDLVDRVLAVNPRAVLDADALNLIAGADVLLTPHPAEAARLVGGVGVDDVLARRWDVARELAGDTGAAVLLKGVPTIVTDSAVTLVSAAGTPVLATGGSGDVLAGTAGTLMVQGADPVVAGWAAAWIHGRAAELAGGEARRVRGVTLDGVLEALPRAWAERPGPSRYPVLLELPAVGEGDAR